jgi:phosphoribosylanthranilate isomerase
MRSSRTAPRIKICCIASVAEAELAVAYGASALGLVSSMPSGPGVLPEETIAEIARAAPRSAATFLLTCAQSSSAIIAQARRCGTTTLQLCDRLERGSFAELREALPGIELVQVIHVTGPEALDEALAAAEHADALLLDSGDPRKRVKELGGTGRRHDWSISRRIRKAVDVPVYLAGGLDASNAAAAIDAVDPYGLDLCSGVRTEGKLDEAKLASFMRAVAEATVATRSSAQTSVEPSRVTGDREADP